MGEKGAEGVGPAPGCLIPPEPSRAEPSRGIAAPTLSRPRSSHLPSCTSHFRELAAAQWTIQCPPPHPPDLHVNLSGTPPTRPPVCGSAPAALLVSWLKIARDSSRSLASGRFCAAVSRCPGGPPAETSHRPHPSRSYRTQQDRLQPRPGPLGLDQAVVLAGGVFISCPS